MSEPIKKKLGEIAAAPTPQNTPASVAGSYMSKSHQPTIPNTIDEEKEEFKKKLLSNPALLSMIEGKLEDLVGLDSGYVSSLPKLVKNRVYGLKSIQKRQFDLEAEFQLELLELERKFHAKYKPLFEKRSKIVAGAVEPTALEIAEGEQLVDEDNDDEDDTLGKITEVEEEEDKEEEEDDDDEDLKGIPSFWLTALGNLTIVQDTITDRDTEVLEHLIDVRLEYLDVPGFKLIFEFSENEFFTNKTLSKTYYYQKELGYSSDFIYDHAEGCNINWVSNDTNVTLIVERRKQRNKHTKQVRTIEKLSPLESFFNFFDPPKAPNTVEDDDQTPDVEGTASDDEENSEDEIDEDLEHRLELDYQIGEILKDKLIPRAVDWFTGEALQYEFPEGEFEDEEDFEDEDEDDEDDDDSEDDSEDDSDAETLGKTKTQPPECKQS